MKKVTTVILLLALAAPLQAGAASIATPPGNSEADQYFESLPSPQGPRSPDTEKTPDDAVEEGNLTPEAAQELREQGKDGRAVMTIVAQTAPSGGGGQDGPDRGPNVVPASANFEAPDEQGMGILFPLIGIAAAVAAMAFVLDRRRHS